MKLDEIVESEWEAVKNSEEKIKHLYYLPTAETKKELPRAYQVTFTSMDTEEQVSAWRKTMEDAVIFYEKNGHWED